MLEGVPLITGGVVSMKVIDMLAACVAERAGVPPSFTIMLRTQGEGVELVGVKV